MSLPVLANLMILIGPIGAVVRYCNWYEEDNGYIAKSPLVCDGCLANGD
jgi:hypothetical protein